MGDLGEINASGWLFLHGRIDDLIICGGENIQPQQIEERILQLSYVQECCVCGQPDAEYGQAIHAFLVLDPSQFQAQPSAQLWIEKLNAEFRVLFPASLRPKYITLCAELPKTAVGKIQRHKIQRRLLRNVDWREDEKR